MMCTIDGKIDSGIKGKDILGNYYNLYSNLEHELKPDAWMCGRVTSEMFAQAVNTPLKTSDKKIDSDDFITSSNVKKYLVVVDTKGILRWASNVLTFGDQSVHELLLCVTKQTPQDYLSYLQDKNISYIFVGDVELDFSLLFQKLKKNFQINTVALEGGALLNGSVMNATLVDEISLIMTPVVLNRNDSPSVFETKTQELLLHKYSLIRVERKENDTIWIRYKKI